MKRCPLIGKKCIQHDCEFWIHLVGMNPQTGQPTDEFGCTYRWIPILLTENASQIRRSTASADKVATEVSKLHGTIFTAMPEDAQDRVVAANPRMIKPPNE